MSDSRPLGVFDSGVGGLTVVQELRRQLPGERLLYLADLERFPYGPRPLGEVRDRALTIIGWLAGRDTKLVVIACNTATAAALNTARERFDIPIVGVIAPGAQAAVATTHSGRVAVISTRGTLESGEYVHAIREANPGVVVRGLAAPELVDIVEAGDADTPRADKALRVVVDDVIGWGADTLVLGCTHYPLLRPALRRVIGSRRLRVIDSAETTAVRVHRILAVNHLLGDVAATAQLDILVTAAEDRFASAATRLFGPGGPMPRRVDVDARAAPLAAAR